jgi:hypothetical protein
MAIEIRPVNPGFVAEIGGIDLSRSVDQATVDAIWEAINRYAVPVFHDQHLDDAQLRDFAANFGALEIGRAAARGGRRRLAHPEIGDISTSTSTAGCASATMGGASTVSAIGYGTPMRPTCRCRSCWGCSMRSRCRRQARSVAAKPSSPICARPMMLCPRR